MKFQKVRNPESLMAEAASIRHAAAGFPPPEHDIALDAEDIIKEEIRLRAAAQEQGDQLQE